jgi:hypothetical protein
MKREGNSVATNLLLDILLHLVGLILLTGLDILGVVSSVVHQRALGGQVHDVGADVVQEVLGVRHEDKDLGVVTEAIRSQRLNNN